MGTQPLSWQPRLGTYANTSKPIIFIPGAASEEALLGAFKKLKND